MKQREKNIYINRKIIIIKLYKSLKNRHNYIRIDNHVNQRVVMSCSV